MIKNDPASYLTRSRLVQEKFRMNRSDATLEALRPLRDAINAQAGRHGSLRAAARVLRVDAGYLSRLRNGSKTEPSPALLRKLGLRRVVAYIAR